MAERDRVLSDDDDDSDHEVVAPDSKRTPVSPFIFADTVILEEKPGYVIIVFYGYDYY
jgi:hypothetical protein